MLRSEEEYTMSDLPLTAPEQSADARALRLELAAQGYRRPVQVMDGNYQLAPGVCPWWDSVKAQAAG